MVDKKKVDVHIWCYSNQNEVSCSGRCLGLITNEELARLVKNPQISQRLATSETVAIGDVAELPQSKIEGFRLVFAISERNGKPVKDKTLLVTQPIDYHSYSMPGRREAAFSCEKAYIQVNEHSVSNQED